MSLDLTASISSAALVSSDEITRSGIRDKFLALKHKQKTVFATGEPTHREYETSFGEQISDIDGRRRWLLDGLAQERWDPDLRARIREILRANEAEIHKGNSRRIATVNHCWMLGYDATHAHPTVVISCNNSTVLKRMMRIVSQHGILKKVNFVLKGIPFCDLRYRMDLGDRCLDGGGSVLGDTMESKPKENQDVKSPNAGPRKGHASPKQSQQPIISDNFYESRRQEGSEAQRNKSNDVGADREATGRSGLVPVELNMNTSSQDPPALRLGAEEITVPASGRITTLGGFIMVDDVCFGLTAMHAFIDGEEDIEIGQQSIAESGTGTCLYDIDWAKDDSNEGNTAILGSELSLEVSKTQQLQVSRRVADSQDYTSESGEIRRIAASSRHFAANGLDWALCELGEWGKYAMNGVHLPTEMRTDPMREYLIFKKLETKPPMGKILVATKRGRPIVGYGTGSDTSIRMSDDDDYRRVWSVRLEESLSSGDSGSWVVDALTGDVYGMVIAGSAELGEEYIIPAIDIGQDICRVMRAQTVRLPNWQDVIAHHKTKGVVQNDNMASNLNALDWESDDSSQGDLLDDDEERFVLAEVIKSSSVKPDDLIGFIKGAKIRPRWNKITLPKGRSMRTMQRSVDRLLAGDRAHKKLTPSDKAYSGPGPRRLSAQNENGEETSRSKEQQQLIPSDAESYLSGAAETVLNEEPPELLDSNPNFRAEKSRRAWRAKKQAGRGPKPHHRKHRSKRSGEGLDPDPVLQAPGLVESPPATFQSKFEMDSEDEQGNLDPDVILVRHKGSIYNTKFPAFAISEGSLLVGHLRQQVARDFGIEDSSRVNLLYKGKNLKVDSLTCQEEGLMMRSEVLCVIKRTPWEELKFLTNKFRTEIVPQGAEFITKPPADSEERDLKYRKLNETTLSQILLKLDAVEVEGDSDTRALRKSLVNEVHGFLNQLDGLMKKDDPADWHAEFLPTKQTRRPSTALPDRSSSSRYSHFRRSGSKEEQTTHEDETANNNGPD